MKSTVIALWILMAGVSQSFAQVKSGNELREACQIIERPGGAKDALEAAKAGYCIGIVKTLLFVGPRLQEPDKFCTPDGVTIEQGARVVLKYLNDNPDKNHQRPEGLAIAAFRKAWPCK
jgi:Rap1a immunity proteins